MPSKKYNLCLLLLFVSFYCLSQSKIDVGEINKLISPDYCFNLSYDDHAQYDADADGIKELVIVIRSKEYVDWKIDDYYAYKICVLKRKNNHLVIIDSTMPYNGNGTGIYIEGDSLIFQSRFSKGYYQLTYKRNIHTKSLKLSNIIYAYGAEPYPRNYYFVRVRQVYYIPAQRLFYYTDLYKIDKKTAESSFLKSKSKTISIKSLNKIGTSLKAMKDPQLNYHDIFIQSGPIHDEMMDY